MDCTFHPRMNRNSERAMREIRGSTPDTPSVGERLYRNSEVVYMTRARAIEEEIKKERTEEEALCTFQPTLIDDKGRYSNVKSKFHIPSTKADNQEDEDRFAKNCTFTPKVRTVQYSTVHLVTLVLAVSHVKAQHSTSRLWETVKHSVYLSLLSCSPLSL